MLTLYKSLLLTLGCLAASSSQPGHHGLSTISVLCTGELPTEWTQANVAPFLKKGSKLQAGNYRPGYVVKVRPDPGMS